MEFTNDTRTTAAVRDIPIDYVFMRGLETSQETVAGSRQGSDHKAILFRMNGIVSEDPAADSQ